jgi:hypothetical protein
MDWDRSKKWVIYRTEIGRGRVRIEVGHGRLPLETIVALRKVVPEFARSTPKEIRYAVAGTGRVDFEETSSRAAGLLAREVRDVGLNAIVERQWRVATTIMCEHPAGQSALLIEDDEEHERTVGEMIAAGVPVVHVAED